LVAGDLGIQQLDNISEGIGSHDDWATVAGVRVFSSSALVV
jgi:hypothetical protein